MERYNYEQAMHDDIMQYINEHYTKEEQREKMEDRELWEEELHNDLWVCDSVTGNASGSYTFNTWKAEEYIAHNLDLLAEAMREFCCDCNALEEGAEWCDVAIRCYVLSTAIGGCLNELEEDNEQ